MSEIQGLFNIGLILLVIGIVLFYMAKLFFRKDIKSGENKVVGKKELISAVVVIVVSISLALLSIKGYKWAGFCWLIFVLGIFSYDFFQNKRDQNE